MEEVEEVRAITRLQMLTVKSGPLMCRLNPALSAHAVQLSVEYFWQQLHDDEQREWAQNAICDIISSSRGWLVSLLVPVIVRLVVEWLLAAEKTSAMAMRLIEKSRGYYD